MFFYVLFKRMQRSAFFYVLCKRTLRSLRSFTFFAKECCVLLHSLQKNVAFFAFFNILKKRMQKKALFFWVFLSHQKLERKKRKRTLRALKERKRRMYSECKRTQCPTLSINTVKGRSRSGAGAELKLFRLRNATFLDTGFFLKETPSEFFFVCQDSSLGDLSINAGKLKSRF